ncbi:hypothetical protein ACIRG5_42515 [Lentzea sp. NPDC102401]|uniref:hypothetical protein n=1 Tax=Lentzea sp. NPDC102401 TaxID=3364128 RepID=UPI0037F59B9C
MTGNLDQAPDADPTSASQPGVPGTVSSRIWEGKDGASFLDVSRTSPGDRTVLLFANDPGRAIGVPLAAAQLRELAADLMERADVLDNVAGRNRKTPAWHIREGEGRLMTARFLVNTSDRFELARAQADIAAAHFTAAVALRGLTTHPQVVVHNHIEQSGKDTA